MRPARYGAALAAIALASLGCGESGPSSGEGATAGSSKAAIDAAATVAPAAGAHPETTAGLAAQITALMASATAGDAKAAATHTDSLALPDAQGWFRERFGAKRVRTMLADYQPIGDNLSQVAALLATLSKDGLTEVTVTKHEKVDDLEAVTYQTRAIKLMLIADPLYSVRLTSKDGKKVFHLWSFVHVGDRFRYVGKMKSVAKPEMLGDLDLGEFRPTDAERLRKATSPPK